MRSIRPDIEKWLVRAQNVVSDLRFQPDLQQVGRVEHIGDGVVTVAGLDGVRLDELVRLDDDTFALAVQVTRERASCVLVSSAEDVSAGSRAYRTGEVIRVPVSRSLIGRVIDPLGEPLDSGPKLKAERFDPIERAAPAIVDRDLVRDPLMTGITVIDTMIPLGRGQRELIIGDRKTGKTSVAIDTIINQQGTGVICVYAAVGMKSSTVSSVLQTATDYGALAHCIFVIGEADAPPGLQWITPYSACTISEFFRDQGHDVLLVIDDLTKHAIIHRQLSLLLRNPPGREAYPGDIFYLHARLLERSAKLTADRGGGSLSTLAIAETQSGDLTAYIPTNLISITDGQIYLEPKLFYEGQKPAINVGMSVSRVGGQTQTPAMKGLAERLRLEYMQFVELEVFTRFGAMLDQDTLDVIEHGKRIRAVLIQAQHRPLSLAEQVTLLLAVTEHRFDAVAEPRVKACREILHSHALERCPQILDRINREGVLSDADKADLLRVIDDVVAEVNAGQGTA